jgi:hypothetical protein
MTKSLSETHSISANVEFPWLVGRFLPARDSDAAKICFIPGQIMLHFTMNITANKAHEQMQSRRQIGLRLAGLSLILHREALPHYVEIHSFRDRC